ncbi:hypothetical protein M422DRAFT_257511 [Sphaerobolus stellatus SS14]|uniref:Uncharacterized protein n=1 Tax=Sphaerobolus stellatus (strain SS14) TaxID=990650 RepID=A0A0C9T2T2_SPHS4|nr:hypothetical protein M422DRAFT_276381 [Sphaerobolus stellatus SS14]KIJ39683.1 hypothetical protein M422DRAFT_257511 [Sphaerobolus stellatus SS14]
MDPHTTVFSSRFPEALGSVDDESGRPMQENSGDLKGARKEINKLLVPGLLVETNPWPESLSNPEPNFWTEYERVSNQEDEKLTSK